MSDQSPSPLFEIRASPIQGLGAFALRRIKTGARLIEYQGERISAAEAARRYVDDGHGRTHVILFTVNSRTFIDAGVGGNDAQYFNHSCAPNCEAVLDAGRIYLEALRPIAPGEELTYDYRLEHPEPFEPEAAQRYACHCGAKNCRGTLLEPRTPASPKLRRPSRATGPR